ncbi:glycosyltransferase [Helicobacter saguini]|uniref:Glycosyltransferase family 2 protein n=1 Tax=Helicobacter saguini TaxID=1548018 RepID=A0A4U8T6W1_9HELI|nr:glycosyltransferase family 2 protein [Helicobacter saguini]MWV68129.1 glycosyltransferase [Helicobacter saguini]TLD95346.1 glycosyltransferase family 2 protein [Helicobacter saguini]
MRDYERERESNHLNFNQRIESKKDSKENIESNNKDSITNNTNIIKSSLDSNNTQNIESSPTDSKQNILQESIDSKQSQDSIKNIESNPTISFLVTYHNQEKFVKDSLESILNLEIPAHYEILIGDDNSKDNTLKIIESYMAKHKNIHLYKMPSDYKATNPIHRASKNRLNLLQHAKGEYVVFLDGDDYLCDRFYIQKALIAFKENPQIIATCFNFKYLNTDNTQTPSIINHEQGIIESKMYIKWFWSHVGAFVFKNKHFKENLALLESSQNFDDNLITLFMLQFGDIYYYKDIVYTYRQSDSSIWNSANPTQRQVINMMDYEIIGRVLINNPQRFQNVLFFRQYDAFKYCFKHKKTLQEDLGEKYESYVKENKELGNKIALKILTYNKLNIFQKIALNIWFFYKKKRRKSE